jgi:outer membrane biosynthesis protein TonB
VGEVVRGFLIFLGLLVMLGGGAVAGAQYAPPDALAMLDSQPQVKDFLATPMALYAGAGAAGFGFLMILLAAFVGRKPKDKPAPKVKAEKAKPEPKAKAEPKKAAAEPVREAPKPSAQPAPAPQPVRTPEPVAAAPAPRPAPVAAAPAAAAPRPAAPQPAAAPAAPPKPKPQASANPPGAPDIAEQMRNDPRLHNRKRVGDLVTLNDALKSYHKKRGSYPVAAGLGGLPDRGAAWIPGLAPDFVPELPRDPALSMDKDGPQYVYVSNGTDYKLLARNVSLVGGTNVEELGVKIDPTHSKTAESASFGFWTPGFASA